MPRRGVALSGGGSRGQFEVGALHTLAMLGRTYDAYAGVSVGALIAAFMAQYQDERKGADALCALFSSITNANIWKRHFPFGQLHGAWKPSLLNSQPLIDLVRSQLSAKACRTSGKRLWVGATSLTTGKYCEVSEAHPELVDFVIASAAYPAFFKPIPICGELWTDGGVRVVTPIKALIDMGCDEIDVIICHPKTPDIRFPANAKAWQVALRALELMGDEIIWKDVKLAQLYNRLAAVGEGEGKREVRMNVIHAPQTLNGDPLHFHPKEGARLRQVGKEAALAANLEP